MLFVVLVPAFHLISMELLRQSKASTLNANSSAVKVITRLSSVPLRTRSVFDVYWRSSKQERNQIATSVCVSHITFNKKYVMLSLISMDIFIRDILVHNSSALAPYIEKQKLKIYCNLHKADAVLYRLSKQVISNDRVKNTFVKNVTSELKVLCVSLTSCGLCRCRSGSTFAQVMICCLMAPNHYLNQWWLRGQPVKTFPIPLESFQCSTLCIFFLRVSQWLLIAIRNAR